MPAIVSQTFADPDAYRHMLRGACRSIVITARGNFLASLTRIELGQVCMERGSCKLARISHVRMLPDRRSFIFVTGDGRPQMWSGRELQAGTLMSRNPADEHMVRHDGEGAWSVLSLLSADWSHLSVALAGCDDLALRPNGSACLSDPAAVARLERLVNLIGHRACRSPEQFDLPSVKRQFDDALVRRLAICFSHDVRDGDRVAQRRHAAIFRRIESVLEERPREPITLAELCLLTGANLRTLHVCCQEFLGMGPARYMRLRRLSLARSALVAADPETSSVTDIALRYGFTTLGRFGQRYRQLFDESPSDTLRRPA